MFGKNEEGLVLGCTEAEQSGMGPQGTSLGIRNPTEGKMKPPDCTSRRV